jgi:biopolymer transport protein ExbB/TolQ
MPDYFLKMGIFAWPLLLLALVLAVLIVRRAVQLTSDGTEDEAGFRTGLNAILFWGAVAAVIGFVGQYSGMYNGLNAISRATEISPALVALGLAESITTTLFGLGLFLVSAVAWFTLGALHRRRLGGRGSSGA